MKALRVIIFLGLEASRELMSVFFSEPGWESRCASFRIMFFLSQFSPFIFLIGQFGFIYSYCLALVVV